MNKVTIDISSSKDIALIRIISTDELTNNAIGFILRDLADKLEVQESKDESKQD